MRRSLAAGLAWTASHTPNPVCARRRFWVCPRQYFAQQQSAIPAQTTPIASPTRAATRRECARRVPVPARARVTVCSRSGIRSFSSPTLPAAGSGIRSRAAPSIKAQQPCAPSASLDGAPPERWQPLYGHTISTTGRSARNRCTGRRCRRRGPQRDCAPGVERVERDHDRQPAARDRGLS